MELIIKSTTIYNLKNRTKKFLDKAKLTHNNKYDYSKTNYINTSTKIEIICPIHGVFKQTPMIHKKGYGCTQCSREFKKQINECKFINKSLIIHNNKYDYSLVKYTGALQKVKIICPKHGEFSQKPNDHLNGQGCRKCQYEGKTGIYNLTTLQRDLKLANTQSTLYLIKHENLYKIGITIRTIQQRFHKSIKVISKLDNITLIDAFNKEQEILEKYSNYLEKPINWKYTGDTEFLNINMEQRNQIIIEYF